MPAKPTVKNITLPKGTVVPNHIALILDGNRRWARARGVPTLQGHEAGFDAGKRVAKASREWGIHTFTIWGFSTENWDRSPEEIGYIMKLLYRFTKEIRSDLKKEETRFVHLGRKDRLPKILVNSILKLEEETKYYKKHILNVALDYGGKDEIVRATQKIIKDGVAPEKVDEKLFESYLDTSGQPYPYVDLFIRPSGEQRTSGLLPWQMAYAEFYWERDHLPDMTPEKLREAILDYSRRRRRFGGNDSISHFKFKPEVTAKFELAWWRLGNIPEGTKFGEYALSHLKEQWGLSKKLAMEAAKLVVQAANEGNKNKWNKANKNLKKFYQLIKDEVKLAFEPSIVASLDVKLRQRMLSERNVTASEIEQLSRDLVAEMYRISDFQATKAGHLRALATVERSLAEKGQGEEHWERAEGYLHLYYKALKDRVA